MVSKKEPRFNKHAITKGEHDLEILAHCVAGKPMRILADKYKCRDGVIAARIEILGFSANKLRVESGCATFKHPKALAPKHPISAGQHDAELLEHCRKGLNIKELTNKYDCTRFVISTRLAQLGYTYRDLKQEGMQNGKA